MALSKSLLQPMLPVAGLPMPVHAAPIIWSIVAAAPVILTQNQEISKPLLIPLPDLTLSDHETPLIYIILFPCSNTFPRTARLHVRQFQTLVPLPAT